MRIFFRKALARYYRKWHRDSLESAAICKDTERAKDYVESAKAYKELIDNNEKAIEFFSIGDNAYKRESALPVEFRGYE